MHHSFHPLFVEYCIFFNGNQDYFECHEVLEEYWKDIAPGDKQHVLVGFIQLATGMYHWRRGNFIGATRMFKKAEAIVQSDCSSSFLSPFDQKMLFQDLQKSIEMASRLKPFQAFSFIIVNDALKEHVLYGISKLSSDDEQFLFNKHKLRDRSDIIQARHNKQSHLKK